MKIKSGGGISMGITKSGKASWKTEPKPRAVNVATNAQQGAAVAFKKAPLFSGPGYTGGKMGPTGVGNATVRPDIAGPGSGRVTYAKGTQGTYGPVVQGPKPAPRDILSEYGPEKSKG
jgi:hypothetical protein